MYVLRNEDVGVEEEGVGESSFFDDPLEDVLAVSRLG